MVNLKLKMIFFFMLYCLTLSKGESIKWRTVWSNELYKKEVSCYHLYKASINSKKSIRLKCIRFINENIKLLVKKKKSKIIARMRVKIYPIINNLIIDNDPQIIIYTVKSVCLLFHITYSKKGLECSNANLRYVKSNEAVYIKMALLQGIERKSVNLILLTLRLIKKYILSGKVRDKRLIATFILLFQYDFFSDENINLEVSEEFYTSIAEILSKFGSEGGEALSKVLLNLDKVSFPMNAYMQIMHELRNNTLGIKYIVYSLINWDEQSKYFREGKYFNRNFYTKKSIKKMTIYYLLKIKAISESEYFIDIFNKNDVLAIEILEYIWPYKEKHIILFNMLEQNNCNQKLISILQKLYDSNKEKIKFKAFQKNMILFCKKYDNKQDTWVDRILEIYE